MENIKLIIWDMDGVKYPITPQFQDCYTEAVAKAACKLIPGMEFELALTLAKKSKEEHKKSMAVFVNEYQLDYLTLGMKAEPELDLNFLQPLPGFIEKLTQTDVNHVLLTEGNPIWTDRILTQLQLKEFYADRHRITKADYPNDTKRSSRLPFEIALEKAGHLAENSLMVEDTEENLRHPKEMGMTTVLISPYNAKEPSIVDYSFECADAFIDHFNRQHLQPT